MGDMVASTDGQSQTAGDRTVSELFEASAERFSDRPAQQYKGGVYDRTLTPIPLDPAPDGEYATLTYGGMRDIVRRLATGFRKLGIEPDDRVGLFADTRMEWAQCDFALLAAGAVVTTVYKSSSPDQVRHLLSDPGASAVVVENDDLLERVLAVEDALDIEMIFVMDETTCSREDVYSLAEVYKFGDAAYDEVTYDVWLAERDPADLASLVYTSGTTGQPKGVKLAHQNFAANVAQVADSYGPEADTPPGTPCIDDESRTVSYLPLAHVFERLAGHFFVFAMGGCVAYAESVDTLKEDFQLVQPTSATGVPRVYEKVYDAIREDAEESFLGERILDWAIDLGRQYHREALPGIPLRLKHFIADTLVFSNVRDALGGNIDFLVSGGGTLSTHLSELYHGMGLPIYEGYGLTEAAPVITMNPIDEPRPGTVGTPVPDVDVKIDRRVLPDENLGGVLGQTGELLVKGPNVTDGYWNRNDETVESFTDAGYFRTGDIVTKRPDGYLVFRERTKQLLVLSTGKNVAPQYVEEMLEDQAVIDQALVLGDGEKFVGALVVPNWDELDAATGGKRPPIDRDDIANDSTARDIVADAVTRANASLESHESVKRFELLSEEFTEENGLLTPTMKKIRPDIKQRYSDRIDKIYDEAAFVDEDRFRTQATADD